MLENAEKTLKILGNAEIFEKCLKKLKMPGNAKKPLKALGNAVESMKMLKSLNC